MKKLWLNITLAGAVLLLCAAGFVAANDLLTLRGAVEQAVRNNPRMELAELRIRKADSLRAQYVRQIEAQESFLGASMGNPALAAQLAAAQQSVADLNVAKVAAEVEGDLARRQKIVEKSSLALEAQQRYLNLIRAEDNLALLQTSLKRAKDIKRLAEVAFEAGTAARSEIMRAEAQVANIEAALFGAESGVKIAQAALNTTLNRDIGSELKLDDNFNLPEVEDVKYNEGLHRALANRVEMAAALGAVKIVNSKKFYGTSQGSLAVDIEFEEAAVNLRAAEDGIRLEVFNLYQMLLGLEKQIAAREKGLELAEENYRISKLRYELGVATQGEVMDALISLSEQEVSLLNDQFDCYLGYLNWRLKTCLEVS